MAISFEGSSMSTKHNFHTSASGIDPSHKILQAKPSKHLQYKWKFQLLMLLLLFTGTDNRLLLKRHD